MLLVSCGSFRLQPFKPGKINAVSERWEGEGARTTYTLTERKERELLGTTNIIREACKGVERRRGYEQKYGKEKQT